MTLVFRLTDLVLTLFLTPLHIVDYHIVESSHHASGFIRIHSPDRAMSVRNDVGKGLRNMFPQQAMVEDVQIDGVNLHQSHEYPLGSSQLWGSRLPDGFSSPPPSSDIVDGR